MTLLNPLLLLFLLLIPVGILASWAAKRRARAFAVRLPTTSSLAGLAKRTPAWRRWLPGGLFAAAIASLVLALAQPEVTVRVPVEKASIMLVTDVSGSMRATDVNPTRLDAAVSAAEAFLDDVPKQMLVGLLTYSDGVELVQNPTKDRESVREAVGRLTAGGGTATGTALSEALQRLRNSNTADAAGKRPPTAILLLSDGSSSDGISPVDVAQQAKSLGIPISTVALGTAEGTVTLQPGAPPRPVPPDFETLREVAAISGGESFAVANSGKLDDVYKSVGQQLGTEPVKREATAIPAALAALLLAAAVAAGVRARPRVG